MAFSRTASLVCVFVAAVCGVTMSQSAGAPDQSLFNLMSAQPTAGTGGMANMGGLDSILNTMGGGGFASGTGSPAPNPSFPTMGGGGMPMGATQRQSNPMSSLFPFMMFSGLDMSKMMMMMLMGGMGGMGGGMGGMGMLPMLGLMNNM